jgi:DNA-binding transcriptional LysR family regulator
MQGQLLGAMRFGLNATPPLLRVASIVTAIHTRYPQVVVTFVHSESGKILTALRERTLDMGMSSVPRLRQR